MNKLRRSMFGFIFAGMMVFSLGAIYGEILESNRWFRALGKVYEINRKGY